MLWFQNQIPPPLRDIKHKIRFKRKYFSCFLLSTQLLRATHIYSLCIFNFSYLKLLVNNIINIIFITTTSRAIIINIYYY